MGAGSSLGTRLKAVTDSSTSESSLRKVDVEEKRHAERSDPRLSRSGARWAVTL